MFEHRTEYGIQTMCRVLGIARAGYYQWLHKPLSDRAVEDQRLLGLIRQSYDASGRVYGAPRVFLDLREVGESCGRNRVAKIMSNNKIKALRNSYQLVIAGYSSWTRAGKRGETCNTPMK